MGRVNAERKKREYADAVVLYHKFVKKSTYGDSKMNKNEKQRIKIDAKAKMPLPEKILYMFKIVALIILISAVLSIFKSCDKGANFDLSDLTVGGFLRKISNFRLKNIFDKVSEFKIFGFFEDVL